MADRTRLDRDRAWSLLEEQAYWARERTREQFDAQLDSAWRLVGAYDDASGQLVGLARAVSDGVSFAYLADVIVDAAHRGHGLGKRIVRAMIDDGPGAGFRWVLFTSDAHGLYRHFGFGEPGSRAMVRPAS